MCVYLYVYVTIMVKEEQTKNLGGRFWTEEAQQGREEGRIIKLYFKLKQKTNVWGGVFNKPIKN